MNSTMIIRARRAAAIAVAFALAVQSAAAQRVPSAGGTATGITAVPVAPTVTVARGGGFANNTPIPGSTSDDVVVTWTGTGAAQYKLERQVQGKQWADIATVPGNTNKYVDVGATKLVPCNSTIYYRVTARYSAPGGRGAEASAASTAVHWQREMPIPVRNLTANSPGKGEVNLSWSDASPVHVFVHYTQVTPAMTPVTGFSVGLQNQASSAHEGDTRLYYVAAACEVMGQGWVIAPEERGKHPHVYVVIK